MAWFSQTGGAELGTVMGCQTRISADNQEPQASL